MKILVIRFVFVLVKRLESAGYRLLFFMFNFLVISKLESLFKFL